MSRPKPLVAGIAAHVLAAAVLVAFATTVRAAQPLWVALDNSPAGTPADIVFDTQASDPSASFFDVFVHGFWSMPRVGTDNLTYQQISVPGLNVLQTVGSPELPYAPIELGVVTGAAQMLLADNTVVSVSLLPGVLPWPHAVPPVIDMPGTPEKFSKDLAVYGGNATYPPSDGLAGSAVSGVLGELSGARSEVYPFHWNPDGTLTVYTHVRYHFSHAGIAAPAEVGSAMTATSALDRMMNAPIVQPWVHWNPVRHDGYYLIICPAADDAAIAPLVTQKEMRGFGVAVAHIEDIGGTCSAVRSYIRSWYASSKRGGDHYCLLVGDVDVIPLCTAPSNSILTDDLYGDDDGDGVDDLGKEVYVGRLSPVDATDLSQQVARILNYEDHPSSAMYYDFAALIAYRTDADGGAGFQNTQDEVWAATYPSSTPSFDLIYGSSPAVSNADVTAAAQRDGILCYAGHGNTDSWGAWDQTHESYDIPAVDELVNHPVNPIVWSLTCQTGSIQVADCVAEGWMEQNTDGAVAFYGGTDLTGIGGNLFLEKALFNAVFGKGITIHGQALEYGEAHGFDMDNAWKYLLLGDPEMHIRRHRVPDPTVAYWLLDRPQLIPGGVAGALDIRVRTGQGLPVSGVQVSLWKAGSGASVVPAPQDGAASVAGGGPAAGPARVTTASELLTNLYSGQDGYAHFQLPALSQGTLSVTVTDDDANAMSDAISVTAPAGVGAAAPGALRLSAMPSVTRGSTLIGFGRALDRSATISLRDIAGREVRSLAVASGAQSVRWDGSDAAGARVANGLYFAHFSGDIAGGTARIIVLH
jgi:hypothetical protein